MFDLPETFCVYCGRTIREGRWRRRASTGFGHICRRCWPKSAEKNRMPPPDNPVVKLANGLSVTQRVEARLKADARRAVSLAPLDYVARFVLPAVACWVVFSYVAPAHGFREGLLPLAVVFGCVVGALLLSIPRARRVRAKLLELAADRQKRIEEAQAFYSSPEWRSTRDKVIRDQGRVCAECGRQIRRKTDVTVDHILPRSKRPDLALESRNLRVLCRSCNSAKRDSMPEELGELAQQAN